MNSDENENQTGAAKLDRHLYAHRFATLFRGVPGPIGLAWLVATALSIALGLYLAGLASQLLTNDESSGPAIIIAVLLGLWLCEAFRKSLYRPLRQQYLEGERFSSPGQVVASAIRRLRAVVLAQVVTTVIVAVVVIASIIIVPEFAAYPIYFTTFMMAPVVYFVASRGDGIGTAISRSIRVARKHVLYVLGIPALFACLGTLVGMDDVVAALSDLASRDLLAMWQAITFYLLYRYLRWIAVSAAYISADEVN